MKTVFIITLYAIVIMKLALGKEPKKFEERKQSQKFSNPGFVKDRFKAIIKKPEMPTTWVSQYRLPFQTSWMDYCDPKHCDDYHKTACGLHRQKMKFKWFQSACHIIVNNQCANYRGHLKYDWVDNRACTQYVMFARSRACPAVCDEESMLDLPVCGRSIIDKHVVLFENECAMKKANCRLESLQEYEEMDAELCLAFIMNLPNTVRLLRSKVCPPVCDSTSKKNFCGLRLRDGRFRRFQNKCDFEKINCRPQKKNQMSLNEKYAESSMAACIIAEILGFMV